MLDQSNENSLSSRVDKLERQVAQLNVCVSICLAVISIVILDQFFPGLFSGFSFLLFLVSIPAAVVVFISAIMGILEWWFPTPKTSHENSTPDRI